MPKLVEEMFGKGKKLKDLTREQHLQYKREITRRWREKNNLLPSKASKVEQLFGKGKKYKDLTIKERSHYNTYRNRSNSPLPPQLNADALSFDPDYYEEIVLQPNTINDAYIAYKLSQ